MDGLIEEARGGTDLCLQINEDLIGTEEDCGHRRITRANGLTGNNAIECRINLAESLSEESTTIWC